MNVAHISAKMKIAPAKLIGKIRDKVSSKVYVEPGYMKCTNILVLDDTPEIIRVLDRFARMEGYGSMQAESIGKAYEYLRDEESFASLRMAFLDIEVGTGLGFEIYNAIRVKNPGLPIVIMSGSFYHKLLYPILACDDCVSFLPKPFTMQSIRHLMREPLALGGDMSQLLAPENLVQPRAFLTAV